jgi:hypothetical protein
MTRELVYKYAVEGKVKCYVIHFKEKIQSFDVLQPISDFTDSTVQSEALGK